jgi:pimeloyl-ACP methyl ester carboxylesterase
VLARITAEAYLDYVQQLSRLMTDPVCYGVGVPRGNGEPVLLIPGFTAGDWSLGTLARWLRRVGYRSYLSGIDLNVGCPRRKVEMVGWRVAKIARETGMPVVLIGHSLGGVLGRAILSSFPGAVRHVVALGSPVRNGGDALHPDVRPALMAVQAFWQRLSSAPEGCGTETCECGIVNSAMAPMPRGAFTAIYTRRDEVVDWRACIDEAGASYEVAGRHASLIVNREVYRALAVVLAGAHSAREADDRLYWITEEWKRERNGHA